MEAATEYGCVGVFAYLVYILFHRISIATTVS